MTAMLSVRRMRAGYDGTSVVQDVSFDIDPGEIVCLLGANGAGKSTIMGVLTGLVPCQSGEILYEGRDLWAMSMPERVEAGLVLSPEGRRVFPNLTVEENLVLGSYNRTAR